MNRALLPVRRVASPRRRTLPVVVVAVAVALPLTFLLSWTAAQLRQPAAYSPVRQTVSVMAGHAGTDRWIMTSALVVMAACYGALALGLHLLRPSPRAALVVAAVAAAGIASSPQPASGTTLRHGAWAVLGELVITLWPVLVVTRGGHPRLLPRRVVITGIITSFLLAAWLMFETYWGAQLGLAERVTVTAQLCWPAVIAVALYRRASNIPSIPSTPSTPSTPQVDTST